MNGIIDPAVNFANAGDNCTAFAGTTLLDCPQIEYDTPQLPKGPTRTAADEINQIGRI